MHHHQNAASGIHTRKNMMKKKFCVHESSRGARFIKFSSILFQNYKKYQEDEKEQQQQAVVATKT